jgi:hypothetical protein
MPILNMSGRPWSRRALTIAHVSLWTILIVAFLCVSGPKTLREASNHTIHFVGPFHSSDSFLHFATGGAMNGSARLIRLFDSLPSQDLIVIFVRGEDTRSSSLGMMTAYLAWPHPVRLIDIGHATRGRELGTAGSHSPAALVFCRVNRPPWFPAGERIGETLEVVPTAKVAKR